MRGSLCVEIVVDSTDIDRTPNRAHTHKDTEEGLRATVFKDHYESLNEYLTGFPLITQVMQQKVGVFEARQNKAFYSTPSLPIDTPPSPTQGAAERIAYEFGADCIAVSTCFPFETKECLCVERWIFRAAQIHRIDRWLPRS